MEFLLVLNNFFINFVFFRETQLNALMKCLDEHEAEICTALSKDLRKCKQEAITNEIELLRNELRNYAMYLSEWAAPEWVKKNLN